MIFQQMKPGTSVIPHFYVILLGNLFLVLFLRLGYHQGQKVNFKVK